MSVIKYVVVLMSGVMTSIALAAPVPAAPVRANTTPTPAAKPAPAPQPAVRVLIKAPREARIASQMSGRITDLPLKMGQSFRRGDLLVGFDCEHQQAQLGA